MHSFPHYILHPLHFLNFSNQFFQFLQFLPDLADAGPTAIKIHISQGQYLENIIKNPQLITALNKIPPQQHLLALNPQPIHGSMQGIAFTSHPYPNIGNLVQYPIQEVDTFFDFLVGEVQEYFLIGRGHTGAISIRIWAVVVDAYSRFQVLVAGVQGPD